MDVTDFSFRALLEDQAGRAPSRACVTFEGRTWTVGEMDAGANRVANALRRLGVGHGDHVAVLLPNGPEIIWCWWGLAKLGAVYVPVNTQLVGASLAHVLSHADACALILDAALVPAVASALPNRPPALRHVLLAGRRPPSLVPAQELAGGPFAGEMRHLEAVFLEAVFATADSGPPPPVAERPDDPALIIYTSGTTGAPKGVLWSRRAQTHHARRYAAELSCAAPGEAVYTCLPFFHVTSMGVTISSYLRGARVAIDRAFDPFTHWRRIREEGAVLFPYVGAMLGLLHKRPPRPDDADNPVRWAMGAAAPREIWAAMEARFNLRLVETWGQTELAGNWLRRSPDSSKIGVVGRPPDRLHARVVDAGGRDVPDDTPGELLVRAAEPHLLMERYYKQPEATAHAFDAGWYHTGDRLQRDPEGDYVYLGRLKDFIRHRGENVSAFEVERAVNTHPDVLESAALGVPAELGEEDVLLCVVRRTAGALTPGALYTYCREHLPGFMLPRYIRFLDALPKTATTRVQKFKLAAAGVAGAWDRQARPR